MRPADLVVVITKPSGEGHRASVAGMPVARRLILAAQAAGAVAIHLASGAEEVAALADDPRVRVPVRLEPPTEDDVVVEIAADVVVHDATFAALASSVGDGRARYFGEGLARVEARPPRTGRTSLGPAVPLVFARPRGFPPMAIATRRDARRATSALLRACRKTSDGWTSTWLNRYVSLASTRVLVHTPLRPNHVSLAILAIGLASGPVAARGTPESLVIGSALLQAQSVLDGCDGELARLEYRRSRLGEWLDTIGDDLSNYVFFGGASLGLHRLTGDARYLLLGAVIVAAGALASAIEYRYLARIGSGDLLSYPILREPSAAMASRVANALQPLFKRDTFVLLTFVASLVGLLGPMILLDAIGAIAVLVAVLRAERRIATDAPSRR